MCLKLSLQGKPMNDISGSKDIIRNVLLEFGLEMEQ